MQDSSQEFNPLKCKMCLVPYIEDDVYISKALQWVILVAAVIALGQSSSSSSLVRVSTITVRLQGKNRCGTSTAPCTWSLLTLLQLLRSLQVVNTPQTLSAFPRYSQWALGDTAGSHWQIKRAVVVPGQTVSSHLGGLP